MMEIIQIGKIQIPKYHDNESAIFSSQDQRRGKTLNVKTIVSGSFILENSIILQRL